MDKYSIEDFVMGNVNIKGKGHTLKRHFHESLSSNEKSTLSRKKHILKKNIHCYPYKF